MGRKKVFFAQLEVLTEGLWSTIRCLVTDNGTCGLIYGHCSLPGGLCGLTLTCGPIEALMALQGVLWPNKRRFWIQHEVLVGHEGDLLFQ